MTGPIPPARARRSSGAAGPTLRRSFAVHVAHWGRPPSTRGRPSWRPPARALAGDNATDGSKSFGPRSQFRAHGLLLCKRYGLGPATGAAFARHACSGAANPATGRWAKRAIARCRAIHVRPCSAGGGFRRSRKTAGRGQRLYSPSFPSASFPVTRQTCEICRLTGGGDRSCGAVALRPGRCAPAAARLAAGLD